MRLDLQRLISIKATSDCVMMLLYTCVSNVMDSVFTMTPGSGVQAPAIMRPLQHHPGAPAAQLAPIPAYPTPAGRVGVPAGAPPQGDPARREMEHATAARPNAAVCKYFGTLQVSALACKLALMSVYA